MNQIGKTHRFFQHMAKVAIANPCYLAIEVMHPRFVRRFPTFSVVLTINSGWE